MGGLVVAGCLSLFMVWYDSSVGLGCADEGGFWGGSKVTVLEGTFGCTGGSVCWLV